MNFQQKLIDIQNQNNSLLCVGLDVDEDKLPYCIKTAPNAIIEFNKQIIEATKDIVCAYKPNLAFYEAMGVRGLHALRETLKLIPKTVITIGDGKRGDIGNTAEHYAKSLFIDFGFDAITVNPYMGFDSVEPFLKYPDKGVFVLALTSNPGSKDFQKLKTGGKPLYEKIVSTVKKWNTKKNIGLVVGATHPSEIKKIRKLAFDMPMLIPGIGKQGGDLQSAIQLGCTKNGNAVIINASRSIIYASSNKDFAEAARNEALILRNQINDIREKYFMK